MDSAPFRRAEQERCLSRKARRAFARRAFSILGVVGAQFLTVQFLALSTSLLAPIHGIMARSWAPVFSIGCAAAALRAAGLPSEVSSTAGTFVCNHVFYGLMHVLRAQKGVRGGFIHLPFLREQAQEGQASLTLEDMVFGVALAVDTALRRKKDLRLVGGQTQ